MNFIKKLISKDLEHVWHPCSYMQDYLQFPPLLIKRARGSHLILHNNQKIIDAISSWWCKSLGHNHPRLKKAIKKQLGLFEHVIAANTYQEPLIALSEKLATFMPPLNKIFYASEGSIAVEIAIKMSLHARKHLNQPQKKQIIALKNAYHGESILTLSVSDCDMYKKPYAPLLHPFSFIQNVPYVLSKHDHLFSNCQNKWQPIEKELLALKEQTSCIIVEPILQAAAGMKLYSADFLNRLYTFAKQHDIHLIADEIMTGCGRTGYPLACHLAKIQPDFVCLGKGLTGGFLPLSAVLTHSKIYDLFYAEYKSEKAFLHSNTMCGNALAAATALECLSILEEEGIYERVQQQEPFLQALMQEIADCTGKLKNVRGIGAVVAADLILNKEEEETHRAWRIFKAAVKKGALLRPLGNTLYFCPPLNCSQKTLIKLRDITIAAIQSVDDEV